MRMKTMSKLEVTVQHLKPAYKIYKNSVSIPFSSQVQIQSQ